MLNATHAKKDTTERIFVVFADAAGTLVTGLIPIVHIQRTFDSKFEQQDKTWATTPASPPLAAEWNATYNPGVYYYELTLPKTLPGVGNHQNSYLIRFDGGTTVANRYQYGVIVGVEADEGDLAAIPDTLSVVSPLSTALLAEKDVTQDIEVFQHASGPVLQWAITDANGLPVDLSSETLRLVVYDRSNSVEFYLDTTGGGLTITGTDNNQVLAHYTTTNTATTMTRIYKLWKIGEPSDTDVVLASGAWVVLSAHKATT